MLVWGCSVLALFVLFLHCHNNFTNAKLQRRIATSSYPNKNKEKSWKSSPATQTGNKYIADHHWLLSTYHCIRNDAYCSGNSKLVTITLTGQSFLFIFLSLPVWLCLKKCSEIRVLVVLLQICVIQIWKQKLQVVDKKKSSIGFFSDPV